MGQVSTLSATSRPYSPTATTAGSRRSIPRASLRPRSPPTYRCSSRGDRPQMISRRTLGVAVVAVLPLVTACGAGRNTTTDSERQTPYVASATAGSLLLTAAVLVPSQATTDGTSTDGSTSPTPSTSETPSESPSASASDSSSPSPSA